MGFRAEGLPRIAYLVDRQQVPVARDWLCVVDEDVRYWRHEEAIVFQVPDEQRVVAAYGRAPGDFHRFAGSDEQILAQRPADHAGLLKNEGEKLWLVFGQDEFVQEA